MLPKEWLVNGESFGADGIEISAHLPYQGKQFSNEEFEQLQQILKRPVGE